MFRTNPGCDCCGIPAACLDASDDFTRGSDEDPPVGWTEDAGSDWAIAAANDYLTSSTASARLRYSTAHTDGVPSMYASCKVQGDTAGDKLRLMIAAVSGAATYLVAELELNATCGTLRLFESTAGSETQLGSDVSTGPAVVDEWHTLTLCYRADETYATDGGIVSASVTTAGGDSVRLAEINPPVSASGTYGGVATGGTLVGEARFDDWKMYRSQNADEDCPSCENEDKCQMVSDGFDDAAIDCRWDQVSGTWSESGTTISSTGSGTMIWDEPSDPAERRGNARPGSSASVSVVSPSATDVTSAIVAYADSSNYLHAELTHNTAGNGTLKIIKVDSGTPTTVKSDSVSFDTSTGTITLSACYIDGLLVGSVTDGSSTKNAFDDDIGSRGATARKIGWSTSQAGEFTSFNGQQTGVGCTGCGVLTTCQSETVTAMTLTVPASDTPTGDCADTVAGTYRLVPDDDVACRWRGEWIVGPHNQPDSMLWPDGSNYTKVTIEVNYDDGTGGKCSGGSWWRLDFDVEDETGSIAQSLAWSGSAFICFPITGGGGILGTWTWSETSATIDCLAYSSGQVFSLLVE